MPIKHLCKECGQSVMRHKQSLSKSLVVILVKAYETFGQKSFHLQKDLPLTKNQYANFQKLKYWGLVQRDLSAPGYWLITEYGKEFLKGLSRVSRFAWTFNNHVVESSHEMVFIKDVLGSTPYYKKREEYAGDAQPVFSF